MYLYCLRLKAMQGWMISQSVKSLLNVHQQEFTRNKMKMEEVCETKLCRPWELARITPLIMISKEEQSLFLNILLLKVS